MAKNRTPQTFEKRQRERDKQLKREAKKAERLARNADKRAADGPSGPPVIEASEMYDFPEDEDEKKEDD